MLRIILFIVLALMMIGLIMKIIQLVWKVLKFLFKASIVIGVIWLAIVFYPVTLSILSIYLVINMIKKMNHRKVIRKWIKEKVPALNEDTIDEKMITISEAIISSDQNKEEYKFGPCNLPYGRINAFLNYFGKSIYDDEVYYYSAVPSNKSDELREYGVVVARTGIYSSRQINITNEGEKASKEMVIPFSGLWKIGMVDGKLNLHYIDIQTKQEIIKKISQADIQLPISKVQKVCEEVVQAKIPHFLCKGSVGMSDKQKRDYHKRVDDSEYKFNKNQSVKAAQKVADISGVAGANTMAHGQYSELKNFMNGSRGNGYGAEYANNTVDKARARQVENAAQNLDESGRQVKNGADRIVNGENIQTKYYKTASESIGAAFEKKQALYLNEDGTMMQIEVPRDQYIKACELMQKRIDSGQVPGVKPGESAKDYVRKGYFTYAQSHNICKSGTIESLTIDTLNGAVCSAAAGGISAVMVFAMAVWNGQDIKEASKASLTTGLKVLGKGTLIYTLTMQLSRDQIANPFVKQFTADGVYKGFAGIENPLFNLSEGLANSISNSSIAQTGIGQTLGLESLTGKGVISGGITGVVVFGPDICRALMGRISTQQLFKNSAIGASGIGGSILGQALIPIPIVGAMVGGAIGGFVAKAVLDEFVEDDAKLMFQILKEEFLDIVMLSNLNTEEFDKVMNMTLCHPKIAKILRDIYASQDYRNFARDAIVSVAVINILSERKTVTDNMITQGYMQLVEELDIEMAIA